MAISITITDGTETVTLTATDGLNESWTPVTPGMDDASVTETFDITLIGGNAAVAANIAELERLFQGARERVGGAYGIAYTYLKVALDSATWRSPVLDGRIVTANDQWIKGDWALGQRKATILITREAWWEVDAEVQIPLSNDNGTNITAGLNVYNCNDRTGSSPNKRCNLAAIQTGVVLGDLPAPVRFELVTDHTNGLYELMISQNIYSNPGFFTTWYEGDITGGTNVTPDGSMSNSNHQTITGSTAVEVYKDITAIGDYLRGGYYRLLARMSAVGTWKIRPKSGNLNPLSFGKTITIYTDPGALYAGDLWWWDLGIVQVPPIYFPGKTWSAIKVGWDATPDASRTFDLDCFQLTPLDGWRHIVMIDQLIYDETLYIDELLGELYGAQADGKLRGYGRISGDPLKVYPNKYQIFNFVWNTTGQSASITAYLIVKLFYRPRRRTL